MTRFEALRRREEALLGRRLEPAEAQMLADTFEGARAQAGDALDDLTWDLRQRFRGLIDRLRDGLRR